MSRTSYDNKRIAKNTLFLYFRMFLIMGVTLYTSRVVLRVLGVEDFGIYNVIGGLLAIFMSISGSLGNASIRFITYSLGNDNEQSQRIVFSSTLVIHLLISILVLILCETIGLYLFFNKLVIPDGREIPAFWAYQYTIISLIFVFLNLPYVAVITAHERMNVYAYISILDVVLRLAVVFCLQVIASDKLATYAFLLLVVQVLVQLCYWIYCRKNFDTTKFIWVWNFKFLKSMFTYSTWIFVGSMASSIYTQGLNILLNMFFGPIINAAQGIAVQVQTAIMRFSENFQKALQPQIILSYAEKEKERLYSLVIIGIKFSYFLMLLIALPLMFQADTVLRWWLGEYPKETSIFVVLFIIICLIRNFSGPLMMAVQATSKIKKVELCQCLLLIALIISYFCLKLFTIKPYMVIAINVMADFAVLILRIVVVLRQMHFAMLRFVKQVCMPTLYVTTFSVCALYAANSINFYNSDTAKFVLIVLINAITVCLFTYLLGMNTVEKVYVRQRMKNICHKIKD